MSLGKGQGEGGKKRKGIYCLTFSHRESFAVEKKGLVPSHILYENQLGAEAKRGVRMSLKLKPLGDLKFQVVEQAGSKNWFLQFLIGRKDLRILYLLFIHLFSSFGFCFFI